MRPHAHHEHSTQESGRIIYLGEVRRRRKAGRAPDRHYLAALVLVAAAGWAAWAIVLLDITPARLLTYVAFLLPLWVALTATGALTAYALEWRLDRVPSLVASTRRGATLATFVVANLGALAARHWSLVVAGVLLLVAVTGEGYLIYRDRY